MFLDFNRLIKERASAFKKHLDNGCFVRIISHLDADGITSASIMAKAIEREGNKYALSTAHQMSSGLINELKQEKYGCYVFTDIGSSHTNEIKEAFGENAFILDHHEIPDGHEFNNLVNPHCCGIEGGTQISGAGVSYLFCKELNEDNKDMSHLAIIGALGDSQENNGFSEINNMILNDAISSGKIEVKRGLRLFGAYSRPIHKALEYSSDPFIPGITGSESNAIKFLKDLGIELRKENSWRKISDLNDEEVSKLISGIVSKRLGEKNPEDVIGNVYLLKEEPDDSPLKDAREFCTMLNACGRMGKASIGITACMGYDSMKEKAMHCMEDYRREIMNALNKVNNKEVQVIREKGFTIINGGHDILPTIIGTVASMVSKMGEQDNSFVLSVAKLDEKNSKASLRVCGKPDIDLREVIGTILDGEGEYGGHKHAAGAVFPSEYEDTFIEKAKRILRNLSMEERMV